ncbi:hypothetical protein Pmani_000885 [Petrolisthes manimaculis]|uniref:UDP-glucuronosyltransferase n=1 Tax=Petrolisthes manimaculis TaxID=1843537 RepID=A0AAE1PQV5_9EUCA|nr:hypothetical protein Pmani_016154 [Petrolisthes manimaculis]KAK4328688.1 hypothetical protein Pmani_000885 [Petrolisthes manimaculis]
MIFSGGIHTRPAQPLPKDLEEWVEGAGSDGFIFFSLGSAVKPSSMPEENRKILLEVFGSLKQRVLWKWDQDTMDDLPPNVRLGKWLPQQDILGDPRLRLFITHGGLLSTLESMYHGIPVLGMPVFADQESNMREVERNGWGRVLTWEDLTPDTLTRNIQFVMTDEKLRKEAARRSVIMKDQPQDAKELTVFWVEYVMRHNGASHLRCPAVDMTWVELYNVDVWAAVVSMAVLLVWVISWLLQALYKCLCSSKDKHKLD